MCIRDRSFTCLNFKSMKAKRMIKKFVAIVVLILVATLSVAGCTSSNNSPSPSAQATSSVEHVRYWERVHFTSGGRYLRELRRVAGKHWAAQRNAERRLQVVRLQRHDQGH